MKEAPKRKYPELPNVKTLLEKVRDGDQQSFDPIYDFYKGRVKGYVTAKYYRDPSSVDDITQEVFLKAYLALKKGVLVPREELGGYLITIAKNHMIDTQKFKGLTRPTEELRDTDKVSGVDLVHDTAETNMELGKTIKAIAELPPVDKKMVAEKVFKTQAEVAQSIGESEIFVHNRLHEVRTQLRQEVGRPRRVWFRGEPSLKPI